MGMNVTGVNSYASNALPSTAPKYTSQVQSSLLSQPAYDTVSFSGRAQQVQTQEKEGMSTGAKVGLVAAAATAVIGIWAASRGKKINGENAKLLDNIKTGVKSLFTKTGRQSYETLVKNSDKLDDVANGLKKVSSTEVSSAAKQSVTAREAIEGLEKEQKELAEKIAKATGDEAKNLQKQADDLAQKIADAKDPKKLMQELAAKKKSGLDTTELQKRFDNIKGINTEVADSTTASLMAKQSLQENETYTKALKEATELKGKLNTLTAKESELSKQVIEKEGRLTEIKDLIKKARKAGQTETAKQLTKEQTTIEKAIAPLKTQLNTLRGTGEGSKTAIEAAMKKQSQTVGNMLTQERQKFLTELQTDNGTARTLLQSFFGSK